MKSVQHQKGITLIGLAIVLAILGFAAFIGIKLFPVYQEYFSVVQAMKNVAGSLRLDLAAFRELEAFAQLGTDLDAATQKQLDRGYRMVELLKQPQFSPLTVEEQVVSIYTGVNGYLDNLSVSDIGRFEDEWLRYMHTEHQDLLDTIRDEKKISDETGDKLKAAADKFSKAFA